MHLETTNPTTPVSALAGSGFAGLAGCDQDHITERLALKAIMARVAVSPQVAALLAVHAGLGSYGERR